MGGAVMVLTLFLVAVGGISAFLFALMKRLERRHAAWGSTRRSFVSSGDDGGLSSSSDTWSLAGWFAGPGTSDPIHHGSSHHGDSCNVGESGASDSWDSGGGSGGDCGVSGGGDGGGGGGGGDN